MSKILKTIFYVLGGISLLICLTFGIGMSFSSFRQATYNFLNVVPIEEHKESIEDYLDLYASLVDAEDSKSQSEAKLKVANEKVQTLTTQLENLTDEYKKLLSEENTTNQEIDELNAEMEALNNEIQNLNYLITDYENQISELEILIDDLNRQLEQQSGFSVSISNLNESLILLDGNHSVVFDSSSPTVELSYLFDLDFDSLYADRVSGNFSMQEGYDFDNPKFISGNVEFNPIETQIHTFLWHPTEHTYMPFDNEHIQVLIDMGYTSVTYSIYAFNYSNGVFSFHMNFNTFHSGVN